MGFNLDSMSTALSNKVAQSEDELKAMTDSVDPNNMSMGDMMKFEAEMNKVTVSTQFASTLMKGIRDVMQGVVRNMG